jgi:predicted  nucleic acid-binding Zn-ribbon protein
VDSALKDLVLLVRLQGTYDSIAAAIRERQTPPPEVKELQQENLLRQQELETLEQQVLKSEEELAEVRKKEQEWKLELEHFQRQKGMVTNEREFTAVISEIDYATKALEEAAERRKELELGIEEFSQDIETRRNSRPEEEAAHREVVEGWENRKEELRVTIHDFAVSAKEIEAALNPKHRARFLRLLESKKGLAVSAVVEGSCSVCHFAMRPHVQQRVRRCEEIITCEHCDRILYLEEVVQRETPQASIG